MNEILSKDDLDGEMECLFSESDQTSVHMEKVRHAQKIEESHEALRAALASERNANNEGLALEHDRRVRAEADLAAARVEVERLTRVTGESEEQRRQLDVLYVAATVRGNQALATAEKMRESLERIAVAPCEGLTRTEFAAVVAGMARDALSGFASDSAVGTISAAEINEIRDAARRLQPTDPPHEYCMCACHGDKTEGDVCTVVGGVLRLCDALESPRAALSVPTGEGCEECKRLRDVLRRVLGDSVYHTAEDVEHITTVTDEIDESLRDEARAAIAHAEGETHEATAFHGVVDRERPRK